MSYDVTINQLTPYTLIDLRGDADIRTLFSQALDLELPKQTNTTTSSDNITALCLGPDQWLLKAADNEEKALQQTLDDAVKEQFAAVTIVSDQYTAFHITGPDTREILAQACSIDLHPSRFGPGQCSRCKFARTWAILLPLGENAGYEVFAESTYTHYLRLWFGKAVGN